MKILLLIPSMKAGGVPVVVLDMVKALAGAGVHFHLVTQDDGPFFEKFATLIPCTSLPLRGFYLRSLIALRRLLREGKFDIVHSHGRGAGLYARLAAYGLRTKSLHAFHGLNIRHRDPMARLLNLALEHILSWLTDAFVCVSASEREEALRARLAHASKLHIIHNGVDIPSSRLERRKFLGGGPVIGTLSRISIQKGLEYLIQALAELRKDFPGICCLIGGGVQPEERPREAALHALAKGLGVTQRINFLGEIPSSAGLLSQIDLYVSSSLWEGLPTAVLEAFAAGIPVVATDVIGNRDLVQDGRTGLLVNPADAKALAAGIRQALSDPTAAETRAATAKRWVRADFSVRRMASSYLRLYEALDNSGIRQ